MLTAIRKSDGIKVIGEEIEKKSDETYFCDFCKSEVIHHKSEIQRKIGHFKHKKERLDCLNNTNESSWHYNTKFDIFKKITTDWGKSLEFIGIEVGLSNNTIRADIFIETIKGTKIAIEVQASCLTFDEIKRRTKKYYDEKTYVLWVLPYRYERFSELKKEYDWDSNGKWGIVSEEWHYESNVKLKDYEIFLYKCYHNQLFFWDLGHEHSQNFISIKFKDRFTDDVEFFRDGEQHSYSGRRTRTTKSVESIKGDISFNLFQPIKSHNIQDIGSINILNYHRIVNNDSDNDDMVK
jgi:competence CoiA-like predicted nuclease